MSNPLSHINAYGDLFAALVESRVVDRKIADRVHETTALTTFPSYVEVPLHRTLEDVVDELRQLLQHTPTNYVSQAERDALSKLLCQLRAFVALTN